MAQRSNVTIGTAIGILSIIGFSCIASAGSLKIDIEGFDELTGEVMVAIYDDAASFPSKSDNAVKLAKSDVTAEQVTIVVNDLPAGTYGISIYHDENGNGKLDKNFFGVPMELYGFSNNVRGFAGPPAFEATLITVSDDQTTTSISLE